MATPPSLRAAFWPACLAAWFGLLWWLSSRPVALPDVVRFPFADKLSHFAYFFAGGIAAAGSFGLVRRLPPSLVMACATLLLGGLGWLDEWHQSHVPGRSGNDFGDWAADCTGAFAGAAVMGARLRRRNSLETHPLTPYHSARS